MVDAVHYLAWLGRADYQRFHTLDPDGLPPRFQDWQRNAQAIEKQVKQRGAIVHRVEIDIDQFIGFCAAAGIEPNSQARARFAADIGRRRRMN